MGQRVLNNPRNVLQLRVLANLADNLVLGDVNHGLRHHLVVTLRAFRCVDYALMHLFVGFVGFLELKQVVFVQSELFLRHITILIVLVHFFNSLHWSAHIVELLIPREMENRLSILIKLFINQRVASVFEIEVSLFLLLKSLFKNHFITFFEIALVNIFPIVILLYDVRNVDFWQLLRNLLFHHFYEFFAIARAKVQVIFIVADSLAIADVASLQFALIYHIMQFIHET